jgi:hypothetical protein
VWQLRTTDGAVLHTVELDARPSAIAVGPSAVWVAVD